MTSTAGESQVSDRISGGPALSMARIAGPHSHQNQPKLSVDAHPSGWSVTTTTTTTTEDRGIVKISTGLFDSLHHGNLGLTSAGSQDAGSGDRRRLPQEIYRFLL